MSFSVLRIIVLAFPLIWLSIVPKANADDLFESMRLELSLIGSQIEDLRLSLVSPEVRSLAPSDAGIALLRLDALEAKLRSTVGRVEALEFHLEILSKDAKHRIYEFNTKLAELENKKLLSRIASVGAKTGGIELFRQYLTKDGEIDPGELATTVGVGAATEAIPFGRFTKLIADRNF